MYQHPGGPRGAGAAAWITWMAALAIAGCGISHPVAPFDDGGDARGDVTGDLAVLDGDASGLDADAQTCTGGLTNCSGTCVMLGNTHDHCGSCDRACAATETCESGACVPTCSGATPLLCGGLCVASDSTHCGDCTTTCRSDQMCTAGTCACAPGRTPCNGACVDTTSDGNHCGACGTVCGAGSMCMSGHCIATCTGGTTACGTSCVNTTTDVNNCGGCGIACAPQHVGIGPQCNGGHCGYAGGCSIGFADCDGMTANGCEQSTSGDPNNCGSCGHVCPSGAHSTATCSAGFCGLTCAGGYGNCDANPANGCEADLNTSTSNCGHCGMFCSAGGNSTATCAAGACGITCSTGFANCNGNNIDGCEASLVNVNTCGSCSTTCTTANGAPSCGSTGCGIQSCNGGYGNCNADVTDGCEAPLNTTTNCGTCGMTCAPSNATGTCAGYSCQVASCNTGYANCNGMPGDGCEVSTTTNTNCGTCGAPCTPQNATGTCSTGTCAISTCNAGFADCDHSTNNGCETATNTATNCGGCGNPCAVVSGTHTMSASCGTGACVLTCSSGHFDCNHDPSDGCEFAGSACPP